MSDSLTYSVEFQFEFEPSTFPNDRVVNAISYVLNKHQVQAGMSLSVVVVDDTYIQSLNSQYRDVDKPTDVLSFPADPLPEELAEAMEDEPPYLGDLIMAYPYTAHQAEEAGHSLDDELVLLAIHGTLHLLGYDHDNAENQAKMWAAQADALTASGVSITVPLFTFGDDRAS